jgi:P2-related tail formation protein
MGIFSDYFFKVLRWPLAHKPGPLAVLVEGLARSLDQVRGDIVWLRNQFNPWTCEPDMIPRHAESRGITQHRTETDEQFARRTVRAFAWHRLGGGQQGMPRILEHFGYPDVAMLNVRAEDPERWAEFKPRLAVTQHGLQAGDYALIGWVAGETKPARSKLAGIQAASSVAGGAHAGGITFTTVRVRLTPERETSLTLIGAAHGGGYAHTVARTRI